MGDRLFPFFQTINQVCHHITKSVRKPIAVDLRFDFLLLPVQSDKPTDRCYVHRSLLWSLECGFPHANGNVYVQRYLENPNCRRVTSLNAARRFELRSSHHLSLVKGSFVAVSLETYIFRCVEPFVDQLNMMHHHGRNNVLLRKVQEPAVTGNRSMVDLAEMLAIQVGLNGHKSRYKTGVLVDH